MPIIVNGILLCDQKVCNNPAEYVYVWTEYCYGCRECTEKALHVARAIGFTTPQATVRPIAVADVVAIKSGDGEEAGDDL